MQLERRIAIRIAIGVKCKPHFVVRRFLSGARRWRRCWADESFCRLSCLAKLLPEQRSWRKLPGRIFLLQGFQLAFQLPQGKRHSHLRCDKKRLDKQHRPKKEEHSCNEQNQSQTRPTFAGRIGEDKRRQCFWRDLRHAALTIVQAPE